MAMALNGLRSGINLLTSSKTSLSKSVSRGLHATEVKRMGGHGLDEPSYIHAKHMYDLDRMKHQKVKVALSVLSAFSIGVGLPVFSVVFQKKRAASV